MRGQRAADFQMPVLTSRFVSLGAFFFRHRSWTPIPFILFLVFCTIWRSRDLLTWVPGVILLPLGEGLRLWAVAVIGKESRTRGSGTVRLVIDGPYAYVRNPLYVGNFLLTLGATFISELLWMVPIAIGMFVIQYIPIVLWEEQLLRDRFGTQYVDYCQRVPRWFPRWRPHVASSIPASYQWRTAWWSERSTLGTLALLLLAMLAKENLPHVFKFLHKHRIPAAIESRPLRRSGLSLGSPHKIS